MGVRTFNIGQDCTVDLTDTTTGAVYSFSSQAIGGDLMSFDADPMDEIIRRTPLSNNGYTIRRTERKGWKGTMVIGRVNGDFEKLETALHAQYHSGQDESIYTIHQTVSNRDGSGSISEYQFTNCVLMMSKGGSYKIGDDVMLSFEFEGDDCVVIQ